MLLFGTLGQALSHRRMMDFDLYVTCDTEVQILCSLTLNLQFHSLSRAHHHTTKSFADLLLCVSVCACSLTKKCTNISLLTVLRLQCKKVHCKPGKIF